MRLHSPFRMMRAFLAVSALLIGTMFISNGSIVSIEADALRLRTKTEPTTTVLAVSTYASNIEYSTVNLPKQPTNEASENPSDAPSEDAVFAYVNTGSAPLNIRSGAGTSYDILGKATHNTAFSIVSMQGDWCEIDYNAAPAYLHKDYLLLMTAQEHDAYRQSNDGLREEIVAFSKNYLGRPYAYGGNGPNSFDCSGFTSFVYRNFGYFLERTATNQLNNGTSVSKDELLPGDLVFFRRSGTVKPVSHVGIYVGDGSFIHASTTGYEVRIDTLASGYYSDVYVYARRIL